MVGCNTTTPYERPQSPLMEKYNLSGYRYGRVCVQEQVSGQSDDGGHHGSRLLQRQRYREFGFIFFSTKPTKLAEPSATLERVTCDLPPIAVPPES